MSLDFMSYDDQERLTKCAARVIDMVAGDSITTPTNALIKVAQDERLNREEIQRIAETYNASAQLAMFKRAKEDAKVEPDDLFDLADGEAAANVVYGDKPKGEKKDDTVDASEYDAEQFTKAASADSNLPAETTNFNSYSTVGAYGAGNKKVVLASHVKTAEEDVDVAHLHTKATNLISQLKLAEDNLRDEAGQYRHKILNQIGKIAEYMRQTDAPPWDQVELHARGLHAGAKIACDYIFKAAGLAQYGHKQFTGDMPKYASVDAYVDQVQDCLVVRDNLAHLYLKLAEADELKQQIIDAENSLKVALNPKLALDPLSAAFGNAMLGGGGSSRDSEEVPSMGAGKPNESLKTELAHNRAALALSELRQDPVLSEYSRRPGILENAYNELTTLQPALANQPIALRAALRRHLTSGGDFTVQEAKQVADFNKEPSRSATI